MLGPRVAPLTSAQATSVARKTLGRFAQANLYGSWLRDAEKAELADAICAGDNVPAPGPTARTPFAPLLVPS